MKNEQDLNVHEKPAVSLSYGRKSGFAIGFSDSPALTKPMPVSFQCLKQELLITRLPWPDMGHGASQPHNKTDLCLLVSIYIHAQRPGKEAVGLGWSQQIRK